MQRQPQNALLLVDDEPLNLQVLRQTLQDDYRLLFAKNGAKALELAEKDSPSLILLDVIMPDMNGYEVCKQLKLNPKTAHIPVIFVTSLSEDIDEAAGFNAGAVDYIIKPISPLVVKARIKTHLTLVSIDEIKETRLQIIQRLGMAAEYKDNETGLHVIRMSHYAKLITEAAGLGDEFAEEMLNAAPMHDIGKIGIPDHILKKPGKLDAEEWEVMRQHPIIGADIIGEQASGLLQKARIIALTHHEKWNGSGYPYGLAGEAIPLEGRITAIADVFDALTSQRPYKNSWTVEAAFDFLQQEAGQHFDPKLVDIFIGQKEKILEIKAKWAESGEK